jgi:hypothetical protein
MTKECTCGDTGYHWLPDENQAKADCWQSYNKAEAMHYDYYPPDVPDEMGENEEILPW